MKTSYKILLGLAVLILVSLLGFNLSMNAKYRKGEFELQQPSVKNEWMMGMATKKLPNFKHLVFNGSVITANGKSTMWMPPCLVNSSDQSGNSVSIVSNLEPLLKYHFKKDTLFVLFQKDKVNQGTLVGNVYDPVIFFAIKPIQSLTIKNAVCRIDSVVADKSFRIKAERANFTINYLKTDSLFIEGNEHAYISINDKWLLHNPITPEQIQSFKIPYLFYQVQNSSDINIENPNRFTHILPINQNLKQKEEKLERIQITSADEKED